MAALDMGGEQRREREWSKEEGVGSPSVFSPSLGHPHCLNFASDDNKIHSFILSSFEALKCYFLLWSGKALLGRRLPSPSD
jgi:hypothetical protein